MRGTAARAWDTAATVGGETPKARLPTWQGSRLSPDPISKAPLSHGSGCSGDRLQWRWPLVVPPRLMCISAYVGAGVIHTAPFVCMSSRT